MQQVLAIDVPLPTRGVRAPKSIAFFEEATRRVAELPGVERVAVGNFVPWRDAGMLGAGVPVRRRGLRARSTAKRIRTARLRIVVARLLRGARRADARRPRFHDDDRARQRAAS